MSKRIFLMSVMLTMVVSLAGMSAGAATIDTSAVTSFLYQGLSYLPLKSTASFLGAPLRWDAATGQAIITYNGQDLALTPNSLKALYAGQPVELTSPPVVVDGVTYIPTDALKRFYKVPVTWDAAKSEVRIEGPSGWRTMKASSRAPWHGGPPPWAPAWGRRGYNGKGHPGDAKPRGNGKGPAWKQRGHGAKGHPSNVKAHGNGKGPAWKQPGYNAKGHQGNARPNGNGKAKGNNKGG